MSELLKRVLFAVPAAALVIWLTWVGGWYFYAFAVILALFIQYEMIGILGKAGNSPDPLFPYTFGLWVLLYPVLPHAFAIGTAVFLVFLVIRVFEVAPDPAGRIGSTLFCGFYAPLGFLTLILLRNTGSQETGFVLTLSLFLMVWGNDILAYFGGKNFGKHLLAPTISPKKTWEGFYSGIAGAIFGLAVCVFLLPISYPMDIVAALPMALLVSLFGPVGDLTESRLKRFAGVKDSSTILPGHGGFFDRFDALILAAPACYVYLILLRVLGYISF